MHEPRTTITGHLAAAPKLRTSKQGHSVADFRVAHTPRVRHGEGWVDGETIWFGVTVWRGLAENVATSLRKGDRVVVDGRLSQRSWQDDQGRTRTDLEIDAVSVGIDLMWSRATSHRIGGPALVSSGEVDLETGEVLMVPAAARPLVDVDGDEADELADDLADRLADIGAREDDLVAG